MKILKKSIKKKRKSISIYFATFLLIRINTRCPGDQSVSREELEKRLQDPGKF